MNTISLDLQKVKENAEKIMEAVEMLKTKDTAEWNQAKWLAIPLEIRLEALKIKLSVETMTQEEFVGGEN